MSKIAVSLNDFISLAVMLLMFAALLAGQSHATAYVQEKAVNDNFAIALDGQIGDQALKIGITVATELSHFRGEDE